jgi:hypothetical protein
MRADEYRCLSAAYRAMATQLLNSLSEIRRSKLAQCSSDLADEAGARRPMFITGQCAKASQKRPKNGITKPRSS